MFDALRIFFSSTESEARKIAQENKKIAQVQRHNAKEDSLANLEKCTPEEIKARVQELTDAIVSNTSGAIP